MECLRFEDWDDAISYVTRMFNMILESTNATTWYNARGLMFMPTRLMFTLERYGFDMGYQKELYYAIITEENRRNTL